MSASAIDLRYPIGKYSPPSQFTEAWRGAAIDAWAATPLAMRRAVEGLDDAQLDTPYRPDGWTVRQLVHHVPDSHLNAYVRVKLALTEHVPTIKPYDENEWVKLADVRTTPVDVSLALLDGVHGRLTRLFRGMTPEQFERRYVHPESGEHTLDYLLGMYAWHGAHHVAHITALRQRMKW